MSQQATTSTEKVDVKGGHLVEKVKELVHEGNVRRIVIKDSGGRTVMEVPVTVGVVGLSSRHIKKGGEPWRATGVSWIVMSRCTTRAISTASWICTPTTPSS